MNWFYKLLGFKEKELPAPGYEEPIREEPREEKPFNIQEVFLEAIQEAHEEAYIAERELLNDVKLQKYIRDTIKVIASNNDHYEFVLVHPHDIKLPAASWAPFAQIMIGLFKEINLKASDEGSYLKVMKKDVKRAFGSLKKQTIDIDERTRAMLSQGIYR